MNLRQAQEQSKRNVQAFLTHLASLPTGSVLGYLELMAKAQFMEGLTGRVFNSVTGRAKGGPRPLMVAIGKMMLDVDPLVDPTQSAWTNQGSGMYRTAWGVANAVTKPFGLEASDVLAEDMVRALTSGADAVEDGANPRGSLFWLAGKSFKEKAADIVSGNIEISDLLGRIKLYAKNLAINFAKHKKVQDKADANAVAEGMLPGVIQTEDGQQYETGDFNADSMSTGSWGSIVAAILANPRDPLSQEAFEWMLDWVENTSQLTDLEKRVVTTYLTELSTSGSSTTYDELASDFGVSPGFISQLMSTPTKKNPTNMGRFPSLLSGVLQRERPPFLNDLDNLRDLSNLARGGAGAWKFAANDRTAAEKALRAKLIRLAHEVPSLRPHVLPLLVTAGKDKMASPMHIGPTRVSSRPPSRGVRSASPRLRRWT